MSKADAYKVLGLKRGATQKEVKSAFRSKSLETHPDKGGSEKDFVRVAQAYELLSTGGKSKTSRFSNDQSHEESLRFAKEAFEKVFDGLDILSDGGRAAAFVDDLLFKDQDGDPVSLGIMGGLFRKALLAGVRFGAPMFLGLLESDSVTVNVGGREMSGSEFKEMREAHKGGKMTPAEL